MISGCTVVPTLPAGLNLNASNCQISGTPQATLSTASSYQVKATNTFGDSNTVTISIRIYAEPVASIDLGTYAGAGAMTASDDHTVTVVNAAMSGPDLIAYEAKILVNSTDCTQPGTDPSEGEKIWKFKIYGACQSAIPI